jgi:hypothetical protein
MTTLIIRPGDEIPDLTTFVGCIEFSEQRLHIRTTRPLRFASQWAPRPETKQHHGIEFYLLDNAFRKGEVCPRFNIYANIDMGKRETVWDLLTALLVDTSPQSIRLYLEEILSRHLNEFHTSKYRRNAHLVGTDGQTVFVKGIPGVNVFSHTLLDRLKPLSTAPDDWDMSHVRAALANGQCEQVKAKGSLSAHQLLELILGLDANHLFGSAWRTVLDRRTKRVDVELDGLKHSTFKLVL